MTCIPRRFEWLKTEDGFPALIALGRSLNQLRFAMFSLDADVSAESEPFQSRQLTSAVFAIAAAPYDGIQLSKTHVGKYYKGYAEFQVLQSFWRGEESVAFLADLKRLRDRAVAHFDPDEVRSTIADLNFADECIFVEGHGGQARDLHCKLADGIAVMTFSGKGESYEEIVVRTNALYAKLANASGEWMLAADALLARVLSDYGFTLADELCSS